SIGYISAGTVLTLGLVRFLHGFAAAMVIPVAFAYIGDLAPVDEEGRYVGVFQTALFLGFGFGPLVGGVISEAFSMKANFQVLGALAGAAALMVLFGVGESVPARRPKPVPILISLKVPIVSGLMTFRFTTALGRGTLMAFLPLFADKIGHLGTSQIGLIISSNTLLSAAFQRAGGGLADRRDRAALVLVGSLLSAAVMFVLPLGRSFLPLLVLNLVLGLSSAVSLPAASALTIEEGRKAGMGQLFGLFNVAMSAGIATGPLFAGGIARAINLQAVFPFAGIAMLLGGLVFYALSSRSQSISAASNTGPS
ncbi:MAG TPA: MFS transporter, partial [Proteobacteria bacterium]|nr:MFS transporter [Pseudomonadota bacterium]